MEERRVLLLDEGAEAEVISTLVESFFDYPVMRFVLGAEGEYAERLELLVGFFVRARVLRDETVLGVPSGDRLLAAALISRPGGATSPAELSRLRESTWAQLGEGARSRYEAFGAVASGFEVHARHLHLNMVGVRRSAQGQGLAGLLLSAVHEISAADPESDGVSLTTETEANVPLYEHFGYGVVGHAEVGSSFTTWTLYRPDGTEGREMAR